MKNQSSSFNIFRAIKKFFLSAFVVVSFIAYALHNRSANNVSGVGQIVPTSGSSGSSSPTDPVVPAAPAAPTNTTVPADPASPTAAAPVTSRQSGQLKDGSYTGAEVDVNWGLVQVQATIQSGRISAVKFLEYPSDRRTSQRINNIVMPELQQEAVQAQSANVNLISGATLTSEGFQMSLQDALNQAAQ